MRAKHGQARLRNGGRTRHRGGACQIRGGLALALGAVSLAASALAAVGVEPAAAAKSPIVLGFVGDLTGVAASTFADGPGGAQARIAYQNAHGGVDGHPLKLVTVDSTSSPTGAQTAVNDLVSIHHVFGIIEDSAFFYGGDRVAQQAGVPVTGFGIDGPEWGQQPFTNMFDVDTPIGELSGAYHTYESPLWKQLGVTKLALMTASFPQSAVNSLNEEAYAAKKEGVSICYFNDSLPFAPTDWTATVLQIKHLGCNGVTSAFTDAPDVALAAALKDAGLGKVPNVMAEGYDNDVLDNPTARAAVEGSYFAAPMNFTTPNAAVKTMLSVLRRYDPKFTGGVPDLGLWGAYTAADLMIYGLEHAGKHLTQSSFIHNLRQVGSWNPGNGLFASPVTFKHFGTAGMLPRRSCAIYVQMKGGRFVPAFGGKPLCGNLVTVPPSFSG